MRIQRLVGALQTMGNIFPSLFVRGNEGPLFTPLPSHPSRPILVGKPYIHLYTFTTILRLSYSNKKKHIFLSLERVLETALQVFKCIFSSGFPVEVVGQNTIFSTCFYHHAAPTFFRLHSVFLL